MDIIDETVAAAEAKAYYASNWEERCALYERVDPKQLYKVVSKEIIEAVGGTVLDCACGSGRDAAWLAKYGSTVFACDASAAMLTFARAHHGQTAYQYLPEGERPRLQDLPQFYKGKLPELSFLDGKEGTFDLILANAVWMHVPEPDRLASILRMKALLRPGGKAIVSIKHGALEKGRGMIALDPKKEAIAFEKIGFQVDIRSEQDVIGRADFYWSFLVATIA